jgi:hypothetical protein
MEPDLRSFSITIVWAASLSVPGDQVAGRLLLSHGSFTHADLSAERSSLLGDTFSFTAGAPARLALTVAGAHLGPGAHATLLIVENNYRSFTFFLRDVNSTSPLYVPDCAAAVTTANDPRSYDEIAADVTRLEGSTRLQRLEHEPEESFESAAPHVRRQPNCPTWLGLSRDFHTFQVNFRQDGEVWDWIQPQFHSTPVALPENEAKPVRYNFCIGRGIGCTQPIQRWLEDGTLPILHAELLDGDIHYHATAFVSLEYRPLLDPNTGAPMLRGTHYLVADHFGYGNMQTDAQAKERDQLLPSEIERDEETVLYLRVAAQNTAAVPRYAWLKAPVPNAFHVGTTLLVQYHFQGGFAAYGTAGNESTRIFLVAQLNGSPLPQEEIALLLQPGEQAVFDLILPHRPLSSARSAALAGQDFIQRYHEVQRFWREKLSSAARVSLPEKRINEMFTAGLLHLDLVAYGLEPDGVVAPCIGVYCPIGSESSPILQFFDAMGWPDLARRSLEYFIAKQHANGFIQNFGGYMLETGAALWSMGEHYRYTGDDAWVKHIASNLIKACDYLLRWSERNRRPELRGRGFGLLDGKVGDPEDPYHIFMLNGYAYLGLARTAEMLARINPPESARLHTEAEQLKALIRSALEEAAARSPLVPLGDGTWVPALPPWAEYRGPVALFAEGGSWFTHGAFTVRDSLIGPLYLIFQEVLGPHEPLVAWLLNAHAELFTERNTAFSQPYYAPHAWVHLRRDEVKPFLKTYYNTLAALADRETYTFWEHFQLISPHKTHEEAWFLQQTRWMLYLEEFNTGESTPGDSLRLMPGIPRHWLADGARIELDGMRCYFGQLKVSIESHIQQGQIRASVAVIGNGRLLPRVLLRLPHPDGKIALNCRGGSYDAEKEIVTIAPWEGKGEVILEY